LPTDNLEPILGVACPNIVFPYLRETVSDLVTRAGFPPVLLAPINFEAMYAQRIQAQQQAQQGQAAGEIPIQ
jgi:preprotein translocase subunit SecB